MQRCRTGCRTARLRSERRGRRGGSAADGLLVAWLLRPSGPLSSDCHSWGLRCRFLWRSHSSQQKPPTKRCLPTPTHHDAICLDRWKDRGLKTAYIFFHWFLLFFCLPRLIHQLFSASLLQLRLSVLTDFCFQSTSAFSKKKKKNILSPTLLPFAPAFTFIYLDCFHLGGNNPLTGSFIRMTSSNPFVAVGSINPAHSLALTEFIMEAQIQSA